MANKVHCDVCDATPASGRGEKEVSIPGRHFSTRNRLYLEVNVYGSNDGDGRPLRDVCDDCRRKMVAEAFGLRTPEEYNALRDERNQLERALNEASAVVPASSVSGLTSPTVPDPDIPF